MDEFFEAGMTDAVLDSYCLRQEMRARAQEMEEVMWRVGFKDSKAGRLPQFTSGSYKKGYDAAGGFRLGKSI